LRVNLIAVLSVMKAKRNTAQVSFYPFQYLDKMQQFYEDVFGWKITNLGLQMGNYRIVDTGEDAAGAKYTGINGGIHHA
jgi:predicted enzyme related to lactoylglutathione lyase